MELKQLKNQIITNTLSDKPLILKYEDNSFICWQYAREIAKKRNFSIIHLESLSEMPDVQNDMFGDTPPSLYVLDVDKLEEIVLPSMYNLIVICKKVSDRSQVDYTEVPKQQPWMIEDYVKSQLPGLAAEQIKWLCEISKYDIYRLDNECRKMGAFEAPMQKIIFQELDDDNAFADLNDLGIFNFTNAIMQKNYSVVRAVLNDLKYIDIEGPGLITILSKQLRSLIDIQLNPRSTAESLNMKPGQFYAISKNKGIYTDQQLIDMYEFITGLDYRLKNGELSFKNENRENNRKFVEYITMNLINIGNRAERR